MKKYNTIIFVPNARSPFRKVTISTRVLTIGASAVALVMVAAVLLGWAYFASARRDRQYLRETAENARLKSATAQLTTRLNGLVRQLDDFDARTRRLAIVAGLTEGLRGGMGGPAIKDNPDLAMIIIRNLVRRLREADRKIESLALIDVYGRVARLLLDHAQEIDGILVVKQAPPKQEIARMIGASREMVSRVVKDLQVRGYIRTEKRKIFLLDKISMAKRASGS